MEARIKNIETKLDKLNLELALNEDLTKNTGYYKTDDIKLDTQSFLINDKIPLIFNPQFAIEYKNNTPPARIEKWDTNIGILPNRKVIFKWDYYKLDNWGQVQFMHSDEPHNTDGSISFKERVYDFDLNGQLSNPINHDTDSRLSLDQILKVVYYNNSYLRKKCDCNWCMDDDKGFTIHKAKLKGICINFEHFRKIMHCPNMKDRALIRLIKVELDNYFNLKIGDLYLVMNRVPINDIAFYMLPKQPFGNKLLSGIRWIWQPNGAQGFNKIENYNIVVEDSQYLIPYNYWDALAKILKINDYHNKISKIINLNDKLKNDNDRLENAVASKTTQITALLSI